MGAAGQYHDVKKEENTMDHKFTSSSITSQKAELLTAQISSPLHKDTDPKVSETYLPQTCNIIADILQQALCVHMPKI